MDTRELVPGKVSVSPVSLGGAMLGGASAAEAAAILSVAVESGIALVDTASSYGHSEERIGNGPPILVATKYGTPCELNGHQRDYSARACALALRNSLAQLREQPIACLQLHSPPEMPSPLHDPSVLHVLESAKARGAIRSWGASVHSVRGGQLALAAGADMLQVPFSILQQENAPLLAQCAVHRCGTLCQSTLCQGWLTEAGVIAARLLSASPSHIPPTAPTAYPSIRFRELVRSVLRLQALAEQCGCTISELALRFVVNTPGVTSALVQVRSASQLKDLLSGLSLAPLPIEVRDELVRMGGTEDADGRVLHGTGTRLWHWGSPTPRFCIAAVLRGRKVPLERIMGLARADADADVRERFLAGGFVHLEGAFPKELAARLSAAALSCASGESYFRCKPEVELPAELASCTLLERTLALLLDAPLYSEHDALAGGFLRASSESREPATHYMQDATVHMKGSHRGAWRPSRSMPRHLVMARRAEMEAPAPGEELGAVDEKGGWHIDFGNGYRRTDGDGGFFDLAAYLEAPWVIVLVLLTDVEPEGGATVLLRGSHHSMARALAALLPTEAPAHHRINVPTMFQLCSALAAAHGPKSQCRATGRSGDVYVLHPLLVHAASVSRVGAPPRCILNVPHPFPEANVKKTQGPLSSVTLPIEYAQSMHARQLCPRCLLALLRGVAISCAARARMLPRRGLLAPAADALLILAAFAFTCFDKAATVAMPRIGPFFTAEEWAAANEYVRLPHHLAGTAGWMARLAEHSNHLPLRALSLVNAVLQRGRARWSKGRRRVHVEDIGLEEAASMLPDTNGMMVNAEHGDHVGVLRV
jgi:aryl-alcohol dehydrogenase-like predicted oxidoreductase